MDDGVTLEKVQELKEKAVRVLMEPSKYIEVDTEIREFLIENMYQVLDILDDALYAHKEGRL